jgi:hypothetical protein
MKKIYTAIVLLMIVFETVAQPTYSNGSTVAGNNSFPFNTATSRKVQWRILANSLNGTSGPVTAGNNITVVYFQTGNNSTGNYPLLNISLKQGPPQFAGGGNYEIGMTQVYSGTNITVSSTTGNWISFTLTTPFFYDPSLPLFVSVEHNSTSGIGPTVYQTSPAGPGFGRLYGNYPNPTYAGADQTVVNFGVDVIPNTPCAGTPSMHLVVPPNFTTCPNIPNPPIGLSAPYLFGGLQYQWYSSTTSVVGPFTAVAGATANTIPTPTISTTTWYQVAVTCTNPGGGTATLSPSQFFVAGSTTSNVPYYEDFEGIPMQGRLPNCSWWASSLNGATNSYLGANTGNRVPRSGNNYAAFSNTVGTHYYYTNGIFLSPNVTYSAAVWYMTDLAGSANFSNLELMLGQAQVPSSLTPIASVNGAVISPMYKLLSNTFTVATAGLYYVAVKATAGAGGAPYLTWDDLSVTVPCYGNYNPVNLAISPATSTICQNQSILLTASGADTFTWTHGGNGISVNETPQSTTLYEVSATNTVTGCKATKAVPVVVKPAPFVAAAAFPAVSCANRPVMLMANGAVSYQWSNTMSGGVITVSPAATSSYVVIGTGTNNCTGEAAVVVIVKDNPIVLASALSGANVCKGDPLTLTASGASTYKWTYTGNPFVLSGGTIVTYPTVTGNYNVTGTDVNGCEGVFSVPVSVEACTSLREVSDRSVSLFPNPATSMLTIETASSQMSVVIADLSGKEVYNGASQNGRLSMSVQSLAAGVYVVKVQSGNTVENLKFIKE